MKTKLTTYLGRVIESFNLAQLGDPETRGTTYSVFASESDYRAGNPPLSAQECLRTMRDAKAFAKASLNANNA